MRRLSPLLCAAGLAATLALAGCQPRPTPSPAAAHPEAAQLWPGYDYAAAASAGMPVFQLDPQHTQIDVVVRREGPLARFGHDHVLTVVEPEGFLLLGEQAGAARADLRFAVARMTVDTAEARRRHGLSTDPDAAAIEGTRENLMQRVLDAQRWPSVTLEMSDFSLQGDHGSARVGVEVNGQRHEARQPFRIRVDGDVAVVKGFFLLSQSALGLQPFSAMGGGLRVADALEIHFVLSASRPD